MSCSGKQSKIDISKGFEKLSSIYEGKDENSLLIPAAKGSALGMVGSAASRVFSIGVQVIVSRLFGSRYFGLFITGLITCQILQTLAVLGMDKGCMRFMSIAHERRDTADMPDIFWAGVLFPLFFGILAGLTCYLLTLFPPGAFFKDPDLILMLKLLAPSLPFMGLMYLNLEVSRSFKTVKYAVLVENFCLPVLQIILLLLLYGANADFHSAPLAFVASVIVSSLLIAVFVRHQIRQQIPDRQLPVLHLSDNFQVRWKSILLFSLPLLPTALLGRLDHYTDIIMLNILADSSNVGVYAAAVRWAMLFNLLTQPIEHIFGPLLAGKLGIHDMEGARFLHRVVTRWMYLIALPVLVFLWLAREPLMLIFGVEFGGDGPKALAILLAGCFIGTLVKGMGLMLILSGRQLDELCWLLLGLVLNIYLNFMLIPRFGITGAAAATACSQLVTHSCRTLWVWYRLKSQPFELRLAPQLLVAMVLVTIGLWADLSFSIGLGMKVGLALIASILMVLSIILMGLDETDKKLLHIMRDKMFLQGADNQTSGLREP